MGKFHQEKKEVPKIEDRLHWDLLKEGVNCFHKTIRETVKL